MKKILLALAILITISLLFIGCPAPPSVDLEVKVETSGDIIIAGDTITILVKTKDEAVTSADLYLFDSDGNKAADIQLNVTLTVNEDEEIEWTIPSELNGNYRVRAYLGGENVESSEKYKQSSTVKIGFDSSKVLIELATEITYGSGTVGFGMWATTNLDVITGTAPNIVFSESLFNDAMANVIIGIRDPETGEFVDQLAIGNTVGRAIIDSNIYDWSTTLVYDDGDGDVTYGYQFQDYAIDDMNDYEFEAGKIYRITIILDDNGTPDDTTDDFPDRKSVV